MNSTNKSYHFNCDHEMCYYTHTIYVDLLHVNKLRDEIHHRI